MRWLLLLTAVVGFTVAFTTRSPGLLALGLLIGLAGLFGFTLAMAAARIAQTAQPAANLIANAEVSAMRARANQKKKATLTQPETSHPLSTEDQGNPSRG